MKVFFENLNWLFLILFLATVVITIFHLPIFWFILNLGVLVSLTTLVVFNILWTNKANLALTGEQFRLNTIIKIGRAHV